ncbi:PAS domain S-box protein [Sphingomonas sp. PsM26]|jgi:PAS domain S-box-containing protein|nr:PAS domain S-box protein [Sphingomonas sp. PsM26]
MTNLSLEAEIARLRSALTQAGIDPDATRGRSISASGPPDDQSVDRVSWQRSIFDSAIDFAIIVTDPSGIVIDWNRGAENVMGWAAAEMRGEHAERFFTPEDRANGRVGHEMAKALAEGRATDERWHLRKSGERFWASGEMMPLLNEKGQHLGFVKILRDRTDEHLAGSALQKAQDRFQTILDTIEAAFAIVEVKFDAEDKPINYRFVEANPAFERQSGVNLRGKWVTEFAPNLEEFWFETYGHVAKTGEPTNFESYAEAFKRWFDVRAVRVGDPADRQIAIFFNDVTERRQAEERLKVSEALALQNIERVQLALEAGGDNRRMALGRFRRPVYR